MDNNIIITSLEGEKKEFNINKNTTVKEIKTLSQKSFDKENINIEDIKLVNNGNYLDDNLILLDKNLNNSFHIIFNNKNTQSTNSSFFKNEKISKTDNLLEELIRLQKKTIGELREIKELLKQTDFSKSISFEFNK
tara:strand:+ start:392 stop:799 length:408 start_codon:yes stop_codon:yes gene_type:complete